MIKTQFGAEIKRVRTDNAKEFFIQTLSHFFLQKGISHESSCVPQQNGIAKRKNGHILVVTRALLFYNNVPKQYWGEAALTATYLINRLSSRNLESNSSIQLLSEVFPNFTTSNGLCP